MLQHDMAVLKRKIFGDCIDAGLNCHDYRKAGTLLLEIPFIETHFSVLGSLATLAIEFQPAIQSKIADLKLQYSSLTWESYNVYRNHVNSKVECKCECGNFGCGGRNKIKYLKVYKVYEDGKNP
eukprot:TRINITY_DN51755_c0_g1_i1.p2 TRINITY_DN51755_c0_g1~~TRINITY_DN51755_c0_g1_i1.p2  ORF type:complete len:124 (-),score=15.14 TRINITY_DN51755_c0_g1_i1:494-865(-)